MMRMRTNQKEIRDSLHALDMMSGRADEQLKLPEPDYERYRQGIRRLNAECKSLGEYDERVKRLAKECGI